MSEGSFAEVRRKPSRNQRRRDAAPAPEPAQAPPSPGTAAKAEAVRATDASRSGWTPLRFAMHGGSRRGREETTFEVESHGILYIGHWGKAALVAMLRGCGHSEQLSYEAADALNFARSARAACRAAMGFVRALARHEWLGTGPGISLLFAPPAAEPSVGRPCTPSTIA